MPEAMFLGVNIDHIATLRQARMAPEPDPVQAAVAAELGGADGITVHIRSDRRHINERDVRLLKETGRTTTVKLRRLSEADQRFVTAARKRHGQGVLINLATR